MKIDYDKKNDSLYVQFNKKPSTESEEIHGLVLDFDEAGLLVGIDIEHASRFVDTRKFEVPAVNQKSRGE